MIDVNGDTAAAEAFQSGVLHEREKAKGLIDVADRILRNPKYTSPVATSAWETALAAYREREALGELGERK